MSLAEARRDAAPDLGLRRYPGSGLVPALRAWRCPGRDGRLRRDRFSSSSWAIIGLRRGRPRAVWADAGRDEKHGCQPLWLLDVSYNFGPRRRQLDPSRAGRARRRRNLLDRDPTVKAGTNFRLPRRRGRGAGTRDARRRQRFQRSHARARVWRRRVRSQRRCDLFLEQYRSAALSSGCGPAAEPDHACSSRRPLRMRSGTQMASSTAGGGAWFASERITLGQGRRSRH